MFGGPISVAKVEAPAFGAPDDDFVVGSLSIFWMMGATSVRRPMVVKPKLPILVGRTNCKHAGSSYNQDKAMCKSETTHV
jgi:hypothetical protein